MRALSFAAPSINTAPPPALRPARGANHEWLAGALLGRRRRGIRYDRLSAFTRASAGVLTYLWLDLLLVGHVLLLFSVFSLKRRSQPCSRYTIQHLSVLPDEDEGSPVGGVRVDAPGNHRQLGLPQRSGFASRPVEILVEAQHEVGRGAVHHVPQAHDHAGDARVEEGPGEAYQPLSRHLLAQGGLAGREHGELRRELQVEDLVNLEKAVTALFRARRQHQAGELGMPLIHLGMGREMETLGGGDGRIVP